MADQDMEGPVEQEREYYCSFLPIPFVKGKPVDYQRMNTDQLKTFIDFMYTSQYKRSLPKAITSGGKQPPWWPQTIAFDKSLKMKIKSNPSHKGASQLHKELVSLVKLCYEAVGVPSLLAIGRELSIKNSGYTMDKCESYWNVTDPHGRTLIMIDNLSRTYDVKPKERDVFGDKDCQENKHAKPKTVSKPGRLKNQDKKRTCLKRKLFKDEKEKEKLSHPCKHCGKIFPFKEFCEEHEPRCSQGSVEKPTQLDFMNALGLLGSSQEIAQKTDASSFQDPAASANPRIRVLRKLPKRNQLLNLIKTNPIPLTSQRGQKFLLEFEERADYSFPPEYENMCKPRSGFPVPDKEYPSVAKRAIIKHGEHPHIYSNGRLQRRRRYQELVVGVNENGWKVLNQCRKARVCIEKISPTMKTVILPKSSKKTSYLADKWRAALDYPKIRLVDFKTNMTPEIRKYLQQVESPKPGTSKGH